MSSADQTLNVHLTRPVNSKSVKIRVSFAILVVTMPFAEPNNIDPSASVQMVGAAIRI